MNEISKHKTTQTLELLTQIAPVKVSPFFKHKLMQEFIKEVPQKPLSFYWLTPQFQWATLGLVLVLNIGTIFYAFSGSKEATAIALFAQEYALQTSSNSILN